MFRVGIIGFGGAGIGQLAYFSCIPDCKVEKVFDPKPAGRERVAELAPGVTACADLEDFLKGLDIVSVCSPDSTHADYIAAALDHGCHVICEKPLTDSVEGIRKIKDAERRSKRVAAVQHQMRYVPVHRKIKACLDSGELGRISYLEGLYVHNLTVADRTLIFDDWRLKENPTPLVYSGCHFVDLLRWFAGEEIEEVYAAANHLSYPEYPESDLNLVTLKFPSTVIGKVLVAFGAECPQDHSVKIYGTQGAIENNVLFAKGGIWKRTLHSPKVLNPKLWRNKVPSLGQGLLWELRGNLKSYVFAKLFEMLRPFVRGGAWQYGVRFYPVRLYEHFLACVDSIDDFVEAIRTSRAPQCTVDEGARTVLACLAGVESFRTNRPVKVMSLEQALE